MSQPRLTVIPLTFKQANEFVRLHHRHNKPATGTKFTIGCCTDDGVLRGVAIASLPKARSLDDGLTIEVNRTCTDGTANVNSCLYGAVWRIAQAMGYRRLVTYTQTDEPGTSLRAAGLVKVRDLPARGSWADHSVALKAMRDPIGNGGVARSRWEITA